MTLSVFHQCYKQRKATTEAIRSFREFYPTENYFLISDGGDDFSDIAAEFKCHYYHDPINLGYRDHTHSSGIYGMTKDEVLLWLSRFRLACELNSTKYILMMEDDVLIRGKIEMPEDTQFSGFGLPGNKFQPEFINYLKSKYDVKFNVDYYGTGGGSIFNAETFLKNYDKVTQIFRSEFDFIKNNLCGNLGWVDVWMPVYYFLSGKEYTQNPNLTEIPHNPAWESGNHSIVHQYKKFYV